MPLGVENCPWPVPVVPHFNRKLQLAATATVNTSRTLDRPRKIASQRCCLKRRLNEDVFERREYGGFNFISISFQERKWVSLCVNETLMPGDGVDSTLQVQVRTL